MAKKVKSVLGSKADKKNEYPWKKTQGMGTPVAEYSEAGPFSCGSCWYLQSMEPRKDPQGFCNEPHMLRDPKTEKIVLGDDQTFAVVDKHHGCCRFIDPVKPTEPNEKFVFAGDPEEESEEHHEMSEDEDEDKEDEGGEKENGNDEDED